MLEALAKLKSGTDIRFNALTYEKNIKDIDDVVLDDIFRAFAYWLSLKIDKIKPIIALGHDSRITAQSIKEIGQNALVNSGCTVLDVGLCSTPSMFGMTKYNQSKADGAIMITASHHPFYKNGLKFFTKQGGVDSGDILDILEYASNKERVKGIGKVKKDNFFQLYIDTLVKKVRLDTENETPLKGLKIVVDAGNGAGGFFVENVLNVLGADTTGSQFLEPDGMFPNHEPNPENAVAMQYISDCVKQNKADLGIIFDTDVDRAACVAPDGEEINRNKLIALMTSIVLQDFKNTKGTTIVTDSVTSEGLSEFIHSLGGVHRRFKRGYKNVINEALRLEASGVSAPLAIETSGHAALKENYFLDDGAYLIVKILVQIFRLKLQNKTLLSLIDNLVEPKDELEVRLGFSTSAWKSLGQQIIDYFKTNGAKLGYNVAEKNAEGVWLGTEDGRIVLRMSVHDPIMPINFESKIVGGCKAQALKLLNQLSEIDGLDLTKLQQVCK